MRLKSDSLEDKICICDMNKKVAQISELISRALEILPRCLVMDLLWRSHTPA